LKTTKRKFVSNQTFDMSFKNTNKTTEEGTTTTTNDIKNDGNFFSILI
jgi:hypothetical protein